MAMGKYITGYAVVRIEGEQIEDFCNQILAHRLNICHLKQIKLGVWQGRVSLSSLPLLRYEAHRAGLFLTVEERSGISELLRSLKIYRVSFVIMMLTLVFLIFYCQSVLDVNVKAEGDLAASDESKILDMAAQYNIAPGLWRRHLQWQEACDEIMRAYPNLSWVGFERSGVILNICVVVKEEKDDENEACGDIVAAKDGVVKSLLVLAGQARVEIDTPVKKGDIIISGEIIYSDEEGNTTSPPSTVRAKGIVAGAVWYVAEAQVALSGIDAVATGKSASTLILQGQKREYLLWGSRDSGYEEQRLTERRFDLGNGWLLRLYRAEEMNTAIQQLSPEAAGEKGQAMAYKKALKNIPKEAKIVNENLEILDNGARSGVVKVRVSLETRENLGTFRRFSNDF